MISIINLVSDKNNRETKISAVHSEYRERKHNFMKNINTTSNKTKNSMKWGRTWWIQIIISPKVVKRLTFRQFHCESLWMNFSSKSNKWTNNKCYAKMVNTFQSKCHYQARHTPVQMHKQVIDRFSIDVYNFICILAIPNHLFTKCDNSTRTSAMGAYVCVWVG